jgi:ring-1,2-phenylacetyl-CoA epoxidase subunit PaaC
VWYSLLADLTGEDRETYPNRLVYHRDMVDFRCVQFVQLPKGDWAFSMLRQYLFDSYEKVRLDRLVNSYYQPVADAAAKMRPEEVYHLRHTRAWVRRLGLGTEESNRRMQAALDTLWPQMMQLFMALPDESLLVRAGYFPSLEQLLEIWCETVIAYLEESNLRLPQVVTPAAENRTQHTPHLQVLLQGLQEIARSNPDAGW